MAEQNPYAPPTANVAASSSVDGARMGGRVGMAFASPLAVLAIYLFVQGSSRPGMVGAWVPASALLAPIPLFVWFGRRSGRVAMASGWLRLSGAALLHGACWTLALFVAGDLFDSLRLGINRFDPAGELGPEAFVAAVLSPWAFVMGLVIRWRVRRAIARQESRKKGPE